MITEGFPVLWQALHLPSSGQISEGNVVHVNGITLSI
jgi:hypothetical protein